MLMAQSFPVSCCFPFLHMFSCCFSSSSNPKPKTLHPPPLWSSFSARGQWTEKTPQQQLQSPIGHPHTARDPFGRLWEETKTAQEELNQTECRCKSLCFFVKSIGLYLFFHGLLMFSKYLQEWVRMNIVLGQCDYFLFLCKRLIYVNLNLDPICRHMWCNC